MPTREISQGGIFIFEEVFSFVFLLDGDPMR
jgi:hypothetical protein